MSGSVVETLTGAPVAGATLSFHVNGTTATATTSAAGTWELPRTGPETSPLSVEVSAAGYTTRRTFVNATGGSRSDVRIDVIAKAAPFSMTFYRQFVRNDLDAPGRLEPIRRWTRAPHFYINTLNPATGQPLTPDEVQTLTAAIRAAVPQMSGGAFEAGAITAAPADRAPANGLIIVKITNEPDSGYCGRAWVGADPGQIEINYACATAPCGAIIPLIVAHEVGHAMGFYHVDAGLGLMRKSWMARDCGTTSFSDVERHHARIAYARPVGNADADSDPQSTLLVEASGGAPRAISCLGK